MPFLHNGVYKQPLPYPFPPPSPPPAPHTPTHILSASVLNFIKRLTMVKDQLKMIFSPGKDGLRKESE